ncbi:MAG: hypothetical protein FWE48_06635 [Coriobacteriia bacterium]|nr:hypothetical protein [Coriobacteriia bacterium]
MTAKYSTDIILYENEHRKNKVCCSLLFKFGFFFTQIGYRENSSTEKINQASSFIFAEYINSFLVQSSIAGVCSTHPKETIIYFETSAQGLGENLHAIVSSLQAEETVTKEFEALKERAKDSFTKYYADGENRAVFKAFEIVGYEEQFRTEECITALDDITLEEYLVFTRKMLHPSNLLIFLEGALEEISVDEVATFYPEQFINSNEDEPSMVFTSGLGRLQEDYFAIEPGREELFLEVYKFYCDNCSPEDTYLFVLFAAIALAKQSAILMYDHQHPSIVCRSAKRPSSEISLLQDLSEEQFDSLKLQASALFDELALNRPQDFAAMIVTASAYNVAIFEIIVNLEQVNYTDFKELISKKYPEIRRAVVQVKKLEEDTDV